MADSLYLSLWYPNLRLASLPGKLVSVLQAFAGHGGQATVYAATVWPINWNEAAVFQRVWGRMAAPPADGESLRGVEPRQAVAEALELLHEDYAYEFQIGWSLWELEAQSARSIDGDPGVDARARAGPEPVIAARWVRQPRLVRVTGFGPLFDDGAYEQEGHIKVDFGSDAPFLEEDADLDAAAARHVEENVRQLVELVAAIEKSSAATARLLWSELGESLAARLAARLGVRN